MIAFRVAETNLSFIPSSILETLASGGADLVDRLIANSSYLAAARQAIPEGYCVPDETAHPHFLTADFALVRNGRGELVPKLVEIQAFPSVFRLSGRTLRHAYRDAFNLPGTLNAYLGGLQEDTY